MKRSIERTKALKKYGWSETEQEQFFRHTHQVIGDNFKGTFTILKVKGKWYWYYKFSSDRISPRKKYLCGCEVKENTIETSFQHATQIFLEKINNNFSNKNILDSNLGKYIDEFLEICMKEGGIIYKIKGKGKNKYLALVDNDEVIPIKNSGTIRRYVLVLKEFKKFCLENNIKTNSVGKKERFRKIYRDYFELLKSRKKKNRNGLALGKSTLSKSSVKLHLQSIRMFIEWLVKPESEYGKGMFKENPISTDYLNLLLNNSFGKNQSDTQRLFDDFSTNNYEKSLEECQNYIRTIWNLYCKYKGNREKIREERFSYNEKLKDGTLSGKKHKNQPKELIVMSDVVFFVSFIQLGYGTRITEILQSYRNREAWKEYQTNTKVSSYFTQEKGENGEMDYYKLNIINSKKKDRTVPINDTIYSWSKPPKHIPYRKTDYKKYDSYETNIIDVIFELFYPKEHPKTFPSPNRIEKNDKGYSTNYYLNLFKEKLVKSEEYNWKSRGINSTHHLRSYFISYLCSKKDVKMESIITITGQSANTVMKYYIRFNTRDMLDTLANIDLKTVIRDNKTNLNR